MKTTYTSRDRNLTAYLMCQGFTPEFKPRPEYPQQLDASFTWDENLDRCVQDFYGNRGVPVQSFVAACRVIASRIREHQQGRG